MKQFIVSNNPKVKNELGNLKFEGNLEFDVEIGYLDVLWRVRNLIHLGHTLLTHPLSGSIKPSETPYKSVVLSEKPGKLDYQSMEIIEDSIEMAKQMIESSRKRVYTDKIHEDFQLVDYALLKNALESINQFR
ncbi:MAG: GrdX family protein [Fusobacteriaceae bacterium]